MVVPSGRPLRPSPRLLQPGWAQAVLLFLLALGPLAVVPQPCLAQASSPADRASLTTLLPRLKDKDPAVVAQTLRALGRLGDVQAFRPILEVLKGQPSPEVKTAGLIALEKLSYSSAFLIQVAGNPQESVLGRSYALYMLGAMRASEGVPVLLNALSSPEEELRERAIVALGKIKDPRAFKPLIVAAHKDPSPALRRKAQTVVEELNARGELANDPDTLQAQLKDPDVSRRRQAAQALSRYGGWWSIKPLAEALNDPDAEVRRYAARALGDLQDRRAVEPLLVALPRLTGLPRQTAITALGVLKDDCAVEPLLVYLQDPDGETRRMTARALGIIGTATSSGLSGVPRAGPALIAALSDVIPENRREVIRTLGLAKVTSAIPRLQQLIKDDVEVNQMDATRALGMMGGPQATAALIKVLEHRNPLVAAVAVEGLKRLGAEEALPALEQVARRHKDSYVREEALEAVVEIKGRKQRATVPDVP